MTDQAEPAERHQRQAQGQAPQDRRGRRAGPSPELRRLRPGAEVPAVAEQGRQGARQPQGRRRRLLHLDQEVPVEPHQDRRDQAQARPMPEPAVQVDQDDDEDPPHVAGQHGGPRIAVGAQRQADRPRARRRAEAGAPPPGTPGPRAPASRPRSPGPGRRTMPSSTASPRRPHQGPGGFRSQLFSA